MNLLLRKLIQAAIRLKTDSDFQDFVDFLYSQAHGLQFTSLKQKRDKGEMEFSTPHNPRRLSQRHTEVDDPLMEAHLHKLTLLGSFGECCHRNCFIPPPSDSSLFQRRLHL